MVLQKIFVAKCKGRSNTISLITRKKKKTIQPLDYIKNFILFKPRLRVSYILYFAGKVEGWIKIGHLVTTYPNLPLAVCGHSDEAS